MEDQNDGKDQLELHWDFHQHISGVSAKKSRRVSEMEVVFGYHLKQK